MDRHSPRRPIGPAESLAARRSLEDRFPDFRQRIATSAFDLFVERHGKPSQISHQRCEARWGTKGSLSLIYSGPEAGLWTDFEAGVGGDTIDWIEQEFSVGFAQAVEIGLKERAVSEHLTHRQRTAKPVAAKDSSAFALAQWNAARASCDTLAERYLTGDRSIPVEVVRALSDAEVVRFHPMHKVTPESFSTSPALLVAASDLAGTVHGFQAVRLTMDGRKRTGVAKFSAGSLAANHAIGWLSRGSGDVICAEGPEDAISVYAARPEAMVGAAFGGMKRLVGSVPVGRRIILAAQNDASESKAAKALAVACELLVAAGHDVLIARPPAGIKDANDLLRAEGLDAVCAMLDGAVPFAPPPSADRAPVEPIEAEATAELVPHYPPVTMDATTAFLEMQIALEDWFYASKKWIAARDYDDEQRSVLFRPDMSDAQRRKIITKITAETRRRFPGWNRKNPPHLQIAGAAGLGKSSGFRAAYLRHPEVWKLQLQAFLPTVALAREFENAMLSATINMVQRPFVALHRGRDHEADIGNAPCQRWRASRKLAGRVPSLFGAMCQRGESRCPHFENCAYISSYLDQAPGMHLFVHDHLTKSKPLNFPKADIAFIDEDATQSLLTFASLNAAMLTEGSIYQTAAQTGEEDAAVELGHRLLKALTSGRPLLEAIRAASLTYAELQALARWAEPVETETGVSPGMSDTVIEELAEKIQPAHGETLSRIVRQLAKELRHKRTDAHGVAYLDGVLNLYRRARITAIPKGIPLLIVDADADLEVNRVLFGENLKGKEIVARRRGRFTQIKSATLAKNYIAPEAGFANPTDRQVQTAVELRHRISEWIATQTPGKKVLAVTNKPVRKLFTGEDTAKIPVSFQHQNVTWTHYGAILGIDSWKDHDAVILIGREQMSASAAEREARAIWCDDPDPLILTGQYRKEMRCHRMRDGSAVPVEVYVHPDRRVQSRVEAKRERAMCQALDRLRLIHGAEDREIFILCNLPLPGIEVDRMMTLDQLLAGGTAAERLIAYARKEWGVLPLVPEWLAANAPLIATSERTAKRLVSEIKRANLPMESNWSSGPFKSANFWLPKQRRPSSALFFRDRPNDNGIKALETLFGQVTVQVSADDADQVQQPVEPATAPSVTPAQVPVLEPHEFEEPGSSEPDFDEFVVRIGLRSSWPGAGAYSDTSFGNIAIYGKIRGVYRDHSGEGDRR